MGTLQVKLQLSFINRPSSWLIRVTSTVRCSLLISQLITQVSLILSHNLMCQPCKDSLIISSSETLQLWMFRFLWPLTKLTLLDSSCNRLQFKELSCLHLLNNQPQLFYSLLPLLVQFWQRWVHPQTMDRWWVVFLTTCSNENQKRSEMCRSPHFFTFTFPIQNPSLSVSILFIRI